MFLMGALEMSHTSNRSPVLDRPSAGRPGSFGMHGSIRHVKVLIVVLAVLALKGQSIEAANYPLELTNIRAAGVKGMDPNHRNFRAYPGIMYNIRAAVVGGAYPYVYSLKTAPEGMTINSQSGEISWPDPQADTAPTITVTDSEGAEVSATWSIKVTATGFKFVDAVRGRSAQSGEGGAAAGTGTRDNPWRTLCDVYHAGGPNDIVYFRSGTYNALDLPRANVGGSWERVEFTGGRKPVMWIAYPGEKPVIDFGYQKGKEAGPMVRVGGTNLVYIDGFETTRASIIGFQLVGGDYATFRRLKMHDLQVAGGGTNAAFIMTTRWDPPSYGMVIQDCEFHTTAPESTTIKIYAKEKLLIEDTVHHNVRVALELKHDVRQFTVRGNRFYDIAHVAIGGNMHGAGHSRTTHGEILFNHVRSEMFALDLNQDGLALQIFVHRNTFQGRVRVRNTDSENGPFYLTNNVIVNDDKGTPAGSHIYFENVRDPGRIKASGNVAGSPADGLIDADGTLTPAHAKYVGTHGHHSGKRPGDITSKGSE